MPAVDLSQLAAGAFLALAAAGLGYLVRVLSLSGAVAALFLGTVVFGFGGLPWSILLLAFFIPSSLLSLIFKKRKAAVEANYEKGSRRDAGQVFANGGLAGLFVLFHWIFPAAFYPWLAASAALAAASADTWATELGALSRKGPLLITSAKRVAKGTSGGISFAGTVASLAGSLSIAAIFLFLSPVEGAQSPHLFGLAAALALGGFVGSLVDSVLGATLQAIYYCPVCQKETEKHPLHHCGSQTEYRRGMKWLNNDWVNFFCTLSSVLLVSLLSRIF